jgi:hypothetical protein
MGGHKASPYRLREGVPAAQGFAWSGPSVVAGTCTTICDLEQLAGRTGVSIDCCRQMTRSREKSAGLSSVDGESLPPAADEGHDHAAGAGTIQLDQKDALPFSQYKPPVQDRNGFAGAEQ